MGSDKQEHKTRSTSIESILGNIKDDLEGAYVYVWNHARHGGFALGKFGRIRNFEQILRGVRSGDVSITDNSKVLWRLVKAYLKRKYGDKFNAMGGDKRVALIAEMLKTAGKRIYEHFPGMYDDLPKDASGMPDPSELLKNIEPDNGLLADMIATALKYPHYISNLYSDLNVTRSSTPLQQDEDLETYETVRDSFYHHWDSIRNTLNNPSPQIYNDPGLNKELAIDAKKLLLMKLDLMAGGLRRDNHGVVDLGWYDQVARLDFQEFLVASGLVKSPTVAQRPSSKMGAIPRKLRDEDQ